MKGVRKELALGIRALKTARTHFGAARCGLKGANDATLLAVIQILALDVETVKRVISATRSVHTKRDEKRRAAA